MLVKSKLTGQEQELSAKDLKVIDPRGTKFTIVKEDEPAQTPPEARTAKAKPEAEKA